MLLSPACPGQPGAESPPQSPCQAQSLRLIAVIGRPRPVSSLGQGQPRLRGGFPLSASSCSSFQGPEGHGQDEGPIPADLISGILPDPICRTKAILTLAAPFLSLIHQTQAPSWTLALPSQNFLSSRPKGRETSKAWLQAPLQRSWPALGTALAREPTARAPAPVSSSAPLLLSSLAYTGADQRPGPHRGSTCKAWPQEEANVHCQSLCSKRAILILKGEKSPAMPMILVFKSTYKQQVRS